MGRPKTAVLCTCPTCGAAFEAPLSRVKRSHQVFCSAVCNNRYHNPEKNKTLMTDETRQKLRNARLGAGDGKTYSKLYGRHEHRVVAEQMLGRPLLPGEVVHHIDGSKRNNTPDNLMVFSSQSEHAAYHAALRAGDSNAVPT